MVLLGCSVAHAQSSPPTIAPIATSIDTNSPCVLAFARNTDKQSLMLATIYVAMTVETPAGIVPADFPASPWQNEVAGHKQLKLPTHHTLVLAPGETRTLGCTSRSLFGMKYFFSYAIVGVIKLDSPLNWRELDTPERYLGRNDGGAEKLGTDCYVPRTDKTRLTVMTNSHPSRTIGDRKSVV